MTVTQIAAICQERLQRWRDRLIREHATPVVLLGLGHDKNSGAITLHCTTDTSISELRAMLLFAIEHLPDLEQLDVELGKPGE